MAEIFKIEYDDKKVRIFLDKLDKNLSQVAEPLEKSARFMQNQARANFRARGRVFQEGWRDWAISTRRVREGTISFRTIKGRIVPMKPRPEDKGGKLMEKTGLLKDSFLIMGPRIGKDEAFVEVYNPIPYAKYHQFGAVLWTGAKLPRRVLLKIAKSQVDEIIRIFLHWLDRISK